MDSNSSDRAEKGRDVSSTGTIAEHDQIVEELALAMQKHLPITLPDDDAKYPGWTMCLCHGSKPGAGPSLTLFQGPVYHRLHVARIAIDRLREAGFKIAKSDD